MKTDGRYLTDIEVDSNRIKNGLALAVIILSLMAGAYFFFEGISISVGGPGLPSILYGKV